MKSLFGFLVCLCALIIFIASSLFLASSAFAEGEKSFSLTWYPLTAAGSEEPVKLIPIRQTSHEFTARVMLPGLMVGTTSTKGGSRGLLEISEGDLTADLGHPCLPVLRYMIEILPGSQVTAELEASHSRTLTLEDMGLDHPIIPVQMPVPKIEGAEQQIPFMEDSRIYARDAFYPETSVNIADVAVWRGRHVALVEVRPVFYNPVQETIQVLTEATLHLRWVGGNSAAVYREKMRLKSSVFDSMIESQIQNTEIPSPSENSTLGSGGGAAEGAEGMLIIVYDDFADAIQPLVEWKEKSGYKVEVIHTSALGNPPNDTDVKSAIQTRYDTWSNPSLAFVLLVGDTDYCPMHMGNGGGRTQVADNWYACTDGTDYLPDLAIARISTATSAETTNVIDKLMLYEKATFAEDIWIKKTGFIGTSDIGHWSMIENTHDYCIDTYMIPNDYLETSWSHGYAACDRHYRSTNANTSEIAASIDEGRSIVNYSGHGSSYSWQGPTAQGSYGQNDVRNNTNDGMYPFVISNACVTGSLQVPECFGETWQREANKGAIAFWGASNNSYWNEDDYLQRQLYTHIYPMDSTPPIGVIVNQTKIDLYNYYGSTGTVAYYFDMYNLLCEPSLSLWTRQPRTMIVSYEEVLPIGQSTFDVHVSYSGSPVENALVAVRRIDEGVFESAYTDADGNVTLTLDPAPATPGFMEITVTKHDFHPHEGTCEFISPDGPWLIYRSHQVDDTEGSYSDGMACPNETIIIPVTVENIGQQPGTGLSGTLSTNTSGWVQIMDDSAAFPDLAPDDLGETLPDHYKVWVKTTATDGAVMGFDLHWTASDSSEGTTSFSEPIIAPDFAFESYVIDDTSTGNGGGTASPGETVNMSVSINNVGHLDAQFIHGVLSSYSPYITILQEEVDFPDIPQGGTGSSQDPPFSFMIADNAPVGQPITFNLSLTEQETFYSEVLTFEVMISSCGMTASTDVPKNILDVSTVESTLDYLDAVTISEVNVFVDIKHTSIGQLDVTLISPLGTTVLLHNNSGGSTDNIFTWYDTETQPAESLSKLNGENAQGVWKLRVEDSSSPDTGMIDNWKIEVCGDAFGPLPYLTVTEHSMDDAGTCNPDGYADVGETVTFHVTIQNTGAALATGVKASLSSSSPMEVLNNPAVLPDINAGLSEVADFQVRIGAVGCLENATLNVSATSNEGIWGSNFTELLEADESSSNWNEEVEHGGAEPVGWIHEAYEGRDDWQVNSTKNHTAGGQWSWYTKNANKLNDSVLITPVYSLLVGGSSSLEFYHWVDLQDGYDGGVLEISVEGSSTWTDLGPYMTEGGYDKTLAPGPLGGRQAWTGSYADWKRTTVDLASWAGENVKLRFRIGCDGVKKKFGWWIDDVVIDTQGWSCDSYPCGIPDEVQQVMVDKSGGNIVVSWQPNALASQYKIYRSVDPTSAGAFDDVTAEDANLSDTTFLDRSNGDIIYFIITANGPDAEGPWGHYGQ